MPHAALIEEVSALLGSPGGTSSAEARNLVALAVERGDPSKARAWARQHAAGAPIGLLTGRQRFMGVELEVSPDVLVPREETELLGRSALALIRQDPSLRRVVDMCCGSGNLAVGLVSADTGLRVWASDLTDACVAAARRNADLLGLSDQITVVQGDLFSPLRALNLQGTIDLVVCNPPYISATRLTKDRAGLLAHEPRAAFDGGPYGVSLHQRLIREAPAFLRKGGYLAMEFGAGQDRQLAKLFGRSTGFDEPTFTSDLSGLPRVIVARRNAERA